MYPPSPSSIFSITSRLSSSSSLRMAQKDILMPALSSTMKEGKIVSWNKKIGDKISSGEVLLVVESDKADMDVESFEDGYLAAIYTQAGQSAKVGAVVASLVEKKDDLGKVSAPGAAAAASPPPAPAASSLSSSSQAAAATPPTTTTSAPAFQQLLMPALSSTMKEGKIVSWSKKIGDKINSGDMVLVVESDKADMDVESYEDGFLAAILVNNGQAAPVGAPVAYLAKTKEEIPAIQDFVKSGGKVSSSPSSPAAAASSSSSSASTSSTAPPASSTTSTIVNDGRVAASGYAKQQAKDQGIDLRTVTPSRSDQYITTKDLSTGSSSGGSSDQYQPSSPDVINATPMARKLAQENNLDLNKIIGTGNFNRVTSDDVLKAAGKYVPKVIPSPPPAQAAAAAATAAASGDSKAKGFGAATAGFGDSLVDMTGMQKAVVKNMEASLSVPVFRVSR